MIIITKSMTRKSKEQFQHEVRIGSSLQHLGLPYNTWGFPSGYLQCKRPRFDPWVGKIPWRRERQPTPVFLPGESHGQRSLGVYSPWGHKELDTNERLTLSLALQHLHTHHHHQESIVHTRAHTWCCAFYRSGQTYGMYPTLWDHTEYFHSPKPLCAPSVHPLSPRALAATTLFTARWLFLVLFRKQALRNKLRFIHKSY